MTSFQNKCPTCGAPASSIRFGIYLTPARLRLFDLINKNKNIPMEVLAWSLYPETPIEQSRRTILSTITAINSLFASTDIGILGPRKSKQGFIMKTMD